MNPRRGTTGWEKAIHLDKKLKFGHVNKQPESFQEKNP